MKDLKVYKKEDILNFNQLDWKFEISSGYNGYRNMNENSDRCMDWIYASEYNSIKNLKDEYLKEFNLIHEFRRDCLEFGKYPDMVILDFLDKKYFI